MFIEGIIKEHNADPTRIGIMGSSMGAISAGGVFVENPNLKCLIGFNGTFAWEEAIKRKHLPPTCKENKALIEDYNPMNNGDIIKDRAILMLHGTEDTSLSIDSQRLFYNKILPRYTKNPEKLEFIEASKVNHHITTGMLEQAVM